MRVAKHQKQRFLSRRVVPGVDQVTGRSKPRRRRNTGRSRGTLDQASMLWPPPPGLPRDAPAARSGPARSSPLAQKEIHLPVVGPAIGQSRELQAGAA